VGEMFTIRELLTLQLPLPNRVTVGRPLIAVWEGVGIPKIHRILGFALTSKVHRSQLRIIH
jgi:hypothetical protein